MTNQNIQTDHYVSRPEGRVYYAKSGNGEPLLLLHPVGISGWSWRKVINDFSQNALSELTEGYYAKKPE